MSYRITRFGVAVVCIAVLVAFGCSRGPSRLHPPAINASSAGKQAIKQYDTDGDGKVAGEELERAPALKAALENLDTDGDGAVSAAEVTARVKAWQRSKLGRMSLSCTVTRGGRPFEGATVAFVPEEFLGDEIQPATGISNQRGMVMLSVATSGPDDPPGVAPGLYRVEITKAGVDVPAKYNTETIFG